MPLTLARFDVGSSLTVTPFSSRSPSSALCVRGVSEKATRWRGKEGKNAVATVNNEDKAQNGNMEPDKHYSAR